MFIRKDAPSYMKSRSVYLDEKGRAYYVALGQGETAKELASKAIRAHLFIKGGLLLNVLLGIFAKESPASIVLAFSSQDPNNRRPIGVAVLDRCFCQVYVMPRYRRQGIGSSMIQLLRHRGAEVKHSFTGASKKFWTLNGVSSVGSLGQRGA